MYIEVMPSTNGQYYFVIKSNGNHHKLAVSELYINRQDALHAAQIIASNGPAPVFDRTAGR